MPQWTQEQMKAAFADKGWFVCAREIQHGLQFGLKEDVKVNLFRTGNFSFGGPSSAFKTEVETFVRSFANDAPRTRRTRSSSTSTDNVPPPPDTVRRVFVVYGHDTAARKDLELLLRRLKVTPVILQNIPGLGDTIIEKLESLTNVDFACVLLTPDDIGASKVAPKETRHRARQNVVLELGMVLSRLGRHRVAILVKGDDLEKPSDIDGLIYIPFNDEVGEVANILAANLQDAGFKINVRDLIG